MEDSIREKNQELLEQGMKTNRLEHENKLLEERNNFLLVHTQHSPSSPTEKLQVSAEGLMVADNKVNNSYGGCYPCHFTIPKLSVVDAFTHYVLVGVASESSVRTATRLQPSSLTRRL